MASHSQIISKVSKTSFSSYNAGIRKPRKFFNLVSQSDVSSTHAEADDSLLDLEILLKQTWNIYGISTMYNFKCNDEVQLKQYAKKLREEIACILSQEDVSYEAKFKVLDIYKPRKTDHPAVEIKVCAQVTGENNKEICVYKGYFFSWRSETTEVLAENTVKLPLLLCRGTSNTIRAVHLTLSRMFDCIFIELPVNSNDLMWLLTIFISPYGGENSSTGKGQAKLEYTISDLPNSHSITIKFLIKNLIDLWRRLVQCGISRFHSFY